MRNTINTLLIAAALTSCENALELEPFDAVSDAGVIVNEKSATKALNGAYHQLTTDEYYGGRYFLAGAYLSSDNVTWTGSLNYYYDFDIHSIASDNQLLKYSWNGIYATVNQANQVIDRTNSLTNISEESKARIVAEATVIRALAFFDLARTWGNVPLVYEATTSPTQFDGVKQTAQKEVYKAIVSDLLSVKDNLSETSDNNHINQSTVDAFLARVYLYQEEWEKAEASATAVISNKNYALVDYNTFYNVSNSKESIWELAYSAVNTNQHSQFWRSPSDGGRREWAPSKELVELLSNPEIGGTRAALYSNISTSQEPDKYVGKLYHRPTNDDPAYIFRLAEQYLIRAEARAKKASPDIEGSLADLNAIRARAEVPVYTTNSVEELISAIELENRVEFALEVNRWYDLVRTGKATKVLGIPQYKTLFPIPYSDISADKDLKQNEGY